ncbi:hypothetical protein ACRAWD_30580 [Caulobacter segnis]
MLTNGVPERAKLWYRQQTPAFRADLDAFAKGINAYAAAHRGQDRPRGQGRAAGHWRRRRGPRPPADELHLCGFARKNDWRGRSARKSPIRAQTPGPWRRARAANGNTLLLQNPHLPWEHRLLHLLWRPI